MWIDIALLIVGVALIAVMAVVGVRQYRVEQALFEINDVIYHRSIADDDLLKALRRNSEAAPGLELLFLKPMCIMLTENIKMNSAIIRAINNIAERKTIYSTRTFTLPDKDPDTFPPFLTRSPQ